MINHPSMTGRGRMIAALLGVVFAFCLPKHVECDEYGALDCVYTNRFNERCKPYSVEPFGISLLEGYLLHRSIGIAYSRGADCH